MSEAKVSSDEKSMWKPRRLLSQILGFAVGVALLAWCVHRATDADSAKEGLQRVRDANPWLIVGLLSCTVVSILANGGIFWIVLRPVRDVGLSRMMLLNAAVGVLNYAPIRLGLIARVAYNLRVDRLSLLQVGGWMAAVAGTLALCVGATFLATVVRPEFDWIWLAVLMGVLVVGGVLVGAMMSQRFVVRHARGMDAMLRHPSSLWGAILLRMVDIAAFVGRMAAAAAILQLDLTGGQIALLAIVAMALSLLPFGKLGFREAGVAYAATLVPGLSGSNLESQHAQLALIESAGELLTFLPLGGLILLFWYRPKMLAAPRDIGEVLDSSKSEKS